MERNVTKYFFSKHSALTKSINIRRAYAKTIVLQEFSRFEGVGYEQHRGEGAGGGAGSGKDIKIETT